MSFGTVRQGQGLIDAYPYLASFNHVDQALAPSSSNSGVEICVASIGRVTYSDPLPARMAGLNGSTGPLALPKVASTPNGRNESSEAAKAGFTNRVIGRCDAFTLRNFAHPADNIFVAVQNAVMAAVDPGQVELFLRNRHNQ